MIFKKSWGESLGSGFGWKIAKSQNPGIKVGFFTELYINS